MADYDDLDRPLEDGELKGAMNVHLLSMAKYGVIAAGLNYDEPENPSDLIDQLQADLKQAQGKPYTKAKAEKAAKIKALIHIMNEWRSGLVQLGKEVSDSDNHKWLP